MNRTARGRIGIVAGSGPEAGVDLWQKILTFNREVLGEDFRGDVDAPHVVVESVPELGWSMDLPETEDQVWTTLRSTVCRLDSRVDVYGIACNTLYVFEERIRELNLRAELVSPIECAQQFLNERSISRAALLGAAPVSDLDGGSPYLALAETVEIETVDDPGRVHRLIEAVKRTGGSRPHLDDELSEILRTLDSSVVLLSCTELPLLSPREVDVELVDLTWLMARELVNRSLGKDPSSPSPT